MNNLIFEVLQLKTGGFSAACLNAPISSGFAPDLQGIHDHITAAVDSHFVGGIIPMASDIHLVVMTE